MKKIKYKILNIKNSILKYFSTKNNTNSFLILIAFLIAVVNTMTINLHIGFYLLSAVLIIIALTS